ncbi:hypothetical protein HPB48_007360 [Haemaphysalis longicornis]|uniref:Cuticle protein n=1 Tax=Haemaphysalis longicornis TaxID=44386 RepID=A0A9J6G5T0_HAELO|nr:hypothetical protein HPB48_007360 [Haemaphysalis longicornis]
MTHAAIIAATNTRMLLISLILKRDEGGNGRWRRPPKRNSTAHFARNLWCAEITGYAYRFALLVALVAVAAAAPVEEYPPQPYSFSYDTTDEFGTRLTRDESSDANNVKVGSYSYTDASGVGRTVKYTADADGFHATVETNEPGTKSSNPADALYSSSSVEVAPAPAPVAAKPVTVTAVQAPVTVHAVHAAPVAVHAVHAAPFAAHPFTYTAVHPGPFAFAKSA